MTYRHYPIDSSLSRPPIPDQGCWVDEGTQPCILPHPIFWAVNRLAVLTDAICSNGFSLHDVVHPCASKDASQNISERVGNVKETKNDCLKIVWMPCECILNADIQDVERAECDCSIVHREYNGGIAEIHDNFERVEEDHSRSSNPILGPFLDAFSGRCATQRGWCRMT